MQLRLSVAPLSLASLLALAACLLTTPALADPAKALEDAGLVSKGAEYVLPDEEEIIKGRREIQLAERALKDAEDDFRDAERKIAKAKGYIAALQREIDDLASRARTANTRNAQDRYIKEHTEKVREIEKVQEDRKQFEVEQQVKIDDARAQFIQTMFTWTEKAAEVADKYTKLAEDPAIAQAIEELAKQDNRRYVLGPSKRFQSIQSQLAEASEEYQRGAVDLRKEGNVMLIDVRVNGKPIRTMVLDTGASAISLPHAFAKDLGIETTANDPIVQLQMADGKLVDAKQVRLESVQVGEFVCKDVEAFVLPPDLHAASPLLGNSFLSNFTYEIDPVRGKLILSRLNNDKDGE